MRKKLLHYVAALLAMLLSLTQTSFAQTTVRGTVTDNGRPLSGVSVTVKGTSTGTTTNEQGVFTISAPNNQATLIVTNVGYVAQEIPLNGRSTVDVQLSATAGQLNEIVVTGYGTQRRREVTSAITTVSAEQFNKGNINDVAQLLQGKVAGLSIARPGGNPNQGFDIRLRGLSTLGANAQPLVVLDGQVGADLNTVDPNDIASVDILKDASSAAIYGTRGSAGVIIITTKKGVPNTTQVNYNSAVTFESGYRYTPHMTASEFRALVNQTKIGTDYGFNTDWYDEITRTAIQHTHNLSFSGGSGRTTYNASLNYRDAQGIAIRTGFDQLNGRLNLVQRALNDRLTFNVEFAMTRRTSDLGWDRAFHYATIYNPTAPVYAQTPSQDPAGGGFFEVSATEYSNPVAMLVQNRNRQDLKRTNINASAELEIFRGLKFLARIGQQSTSTFTDAFTPSNAFIDRGFYNGATGVGRRGYAFQRDDENLNRLNEEILTFTTKVKDVDATLVAGYSYQDFTNNGFNVGAGNFITNQSGANFATAQDIRRGQATVNSYKNGSKLVAFFGRLNLNFRNMAFLAASLRREGSTQFGANNRWGNFPAVSAGVDLTRFLNLAAFTTLKLRGSYGVTGSLPPGSYLSQFTLGPGNFYLINGEFLQTFGPNQNANPDLKWERKAELDIGLDASLLRGRLTATLDYYKRTTTDLIFNVTVPAPPALFNRQWSNVGDLTANGFEAALNFTAIKKADFGWTTAVNYSRNKVKLTRLDPSAGNFIGETNLGSPGQEATQITRTFAGGEIGSFYNAVYRGVDANGKFLFDDGTGKAVLSTQTTYKTVIGQGLPDFEMGWSNTFNYKRFDLNFFIRGSFGHQIINTQRAFYENPTVAAIYNVVKTKYFNPNLRDAQIFSSYYVEDGDFAKLDNATLGYSFSLPKGAFRSLRAFVTGYNLFVITGYTGADPEVRYADRITTLDAPNILAPGIDRRATWVLPRSFTFGVNVGF
jgi:TonB-dependent starch-binding outer membrane protein SusC